MYRVAITSKARRQLKKLAKRDPAAYRAVESGVDTLSQWPNVANVKKLSSHGCGYRLTAGRYRILFDVAESVRVIEVQEVRKRNESTY